MQQRVLLVHPSPELRDVLERALARIGVPIDIGDGGGDAVPLSDGRPPTILVADHSIAGGLLDRVRSLSPPPVVIVTATAAAATQLDPASVSLLIPMPYDPAMVAGVVLACVAEGAGAAAAAASLAPQQVRGEGAGTC